MEKGSTVDNTMISFDRVTKTYGTGQKALDDVSLQIEKGEFVFLVGNSGAGKTTLLELILRETEADQGNIVVNGIDLRQLKERQVCRYRRYIGMVFQDFCLFPDFTVYENVAFAQRVVEADHKRMRSRVMEVLGQVGLEKKAGCYPGQLSGGEKQRTALARAVVTSRYFCWLMNLRGIWIRRMPKRLCACWRRLTVRARLCLWYPIIRSW